jgi:uncharacterized protein YcbX
MAMVAVAGCREVGRLIALWRYPVKSMAAEGLAEADVSWFGLAGDRRWAFIRDGQVRSGFPWLTLRERPDMRHYRPSFVEPEQPDASAVQVRTPSGALHDVADPALAEELGPGVRVIKQNRGIFDTFPLALISKQTIASLGARVGRELELQRFRPNFLVDAGGDAQFPEDEWLGRVLRIGSLRLRLDRRDRRCVVVNIDPTTTARDPAILRTVARERDSCLGVYGTPVSPGRVAVGDAVLVEGDRSVADHDLRTRSTA